MSIFRSNDIVCALLEMQAKRGECKRTQKNWYTLAYAQWFWTISRPSFYQSIYEKCGYSQLKLIRGRKCATKNHWINHAVHCEWTILQYVGWREEQTEQNRTEQEKNGRRIRITLSTFSGISWRHFVVCWVLLFSFAAAADEFQIRRHIVFAVVATRRIQFFVSRDSIFVDLLKP